MALAELAALEQLERLVGEVEQADQIRDRDAAAADPQADLLARETELLDEAAQARASSTGLRSSRAMFSITASSSEAASSCWRTTAGIVSSSAICAARQRRSPATSS